jgi:hypothetical protein
MIKSMRRGTIRISIDLINDNIELVHKLFSKFTPVITDDNFFTNQITYYGFCDDFREIKSGEIVPEYIGVCNDKGEVVFEEIK